MDRKLFAAIIKESRKQGFTGKSLEDFRDWAAEPEQNITEFNVNGKSYTMDDIAGAWTTKAVVISYDPAEDDVIIEEAGGEEVAEMDEDEAEGKSEDEDEVEAKSLTKEIRKSRGNSNMTKRVRGMSGSAGKAVTRDDISKKMYDRAIKDGSDYNGKRPAFHSAERAELVGAILRKSIWGGRGYGAEHADDKIIETKASSQVNSTGAALIFGEDVPELIENLNSHGAARRAAGVTSMREGTRRVARISDDLTVTDLGAGDALTETDATLNTVQLVADKAGCYVHVDNELQNDSAFAVGDIMLRSFTRAIGKWEDQSYFLGQHNRTGISSQIGSNTSFDSNSGGWGSITISDVKTATGLLPEWALEDPTWGYACSLSFYHSVLMKFALDAGGNTGREVLDGFNSGVPTFEGRPVHITSVMPQAYADGQEALYVGSFARSTKFGIVNGSERFDSSEHVRFLNDQTTLRFVERFAMSMHDVNDTANKSGVVALLA